MEKINKQKNFWNTTLWGNKVGITANAMIKNKLLRNMNNLVCFWSGYTGSTAFRVWAVGGYRIKPERGLPALLFPEVRKVNKFH